MTLLGELLLGSRASSKGRFHPSENPASWWPSAGEESATGLQINERNSLAHSAVYQAVQLIAGLHSILPCHVYEREGEDRKEATGHNLWPVLHEEPNPESSWVQFSQAQMLNKLTYGNRYAELEFTGAGRGGMRIWHLPSDQVTPKRVYKRPGGGVTFDAAQATPEDRKRGGTVTYEVKATMGGTVYIEPARMLHVPDLSFNGLVGFSRIRTALESIAVGQARLKAVAAVYGNDSTPGGVLERPPGAPGLSPTGERSLIAAWESVHGGVNRKGRTAVLQEGTVFKPVSFSPKDAMVIEAGQFSILEVAHIFNLDPSWLGHAGSSRDYANIEASWTFLAVRSMMPHVRADEAEMRRKLLLPRERGRFFIEYDVKGLMRGDSVARAAFYRTMATLRVMTPNDIARAENMPRIPAEKGGDDYGLQVGKPAPAAPEPAVPPAPPAPDDDQVARAFRPLLETALARAAAREVAEIRKAAERPGLGDWLPGFYRGHREWLQKVVAPVIDAHRQATGREAGAGAEFSERLVARHSAQLKQAIASRPVCDYLAAVLESWELDAAALAAKEIA